MPKKCKNCSKERPAEACWDLIEPGDGFTSHSFCSPPCIHEWLSEHYGEQPLQPTTKQ